MEKKLIGILRELFHRDGDEPVSIQQMAKHLVERGVTVERWIPVTKKLPPHPHKLEWPEDEEDDYVEWKSEPVLVFDGEQHIAEHYAGENVWLSADNDTYYENVTHWRRLPEGPKEDT